MGDGVKKTAQEIVADIEELERQEDELRNELPWIRDDDEWESVMMDIRNIMDKISELTDLLRSESVTPSPCHPLTLSGAGGD